MDINSYPPIDGKRFDQWPKWEGRGVPTRDTCDLTNPRQKFLWMFTAAPGQNGAPLLMPDEFFEMQSYAMCVLGADLVSDPLLKWNPPSNMVASRWGAQGEWVKPEDWKPNPSTVADILAQLPQQDRADVKDVILNKLGAEDVSHPSVPAGWLRVDTVAQRLGVEVGAVQALLSDFGMTVSEGGLVSRDIADRVVAHLGLT